MQETTIPQQPSKGGFFDLPCSEAYFLFYVSHFAESEQPEGELHGLGSCRRRRGGRTGAGRTRRVRPMLFLIGLPEELSELWSDHHAAIARVRVVGKIVLVIIFGNVKLFERRYFGNDRAVEGFLCLF